MMTLVLALTFVSQIIGSWLVQTNTDPFTDITNCQITTMQEGTLVVIGNTGKDDLGVVVLFDYPLRSHFHRVDMRFRFDSDEPQDERWNIALNHKLVFSPHPEAFASRLRTATRLAVQAIDSSGDMKTLTFQFEKNVEAFAELDTCLGGP